ncbi:MAG: glycosyltransferase family 4 protein, partial [Planctomycetota bacterium]
PASFTARLRRLVRRRRIAGGLARHDGSRPARCRAPAGCGPFHDDRSEQGADLLKQLPRADVIHLHWVARFVDYRAFLPAAAERAPLVWTLHDMNPFTGGCHYDRDCGRYRESCGACPQLGSARDGDLSRAVWRRKSSALSRIRAGRLHVVANSSWLADESRSGPLLGRFPTSVIQLGLDGEVFKPGDRRCARRVLGVPAEARVILFVAHSVDSRRKGFALLVEAVRSLEGSENLFLLSVGRGRPEAPVGKARAMHLGYVGNDTFLSAAYNAADVLAIPSLQEAFGQTACEAMACGTPVVGFDAGGIPDMVRPGVTGLLVPVGDTAALARAIGGLLGDDAKREEMAAACRKVAVEEYSLELQARRYAELYERILSGAG